MLARVRRRYLDLLGSIYIYNEHRGYTAIDRVSEAVRSRWPADNDLIAAVEKHRVDERKHYMMFQRWFEVRGVMPYEVGRTCGHIDRFIELLFGRRIDDLKTQKVVTSDDLFGRLCRVISLTEKRGHRQLAILLRNRFVLSDKVLVKIFTIIKKDEPSHWAPYDKWLLEHGQREPRWWERAVDTFIHSELLFLKLPVLFLSPRLTRLKAWPDCGEDGSREAAVPAQPQSSGRFVVATSRFARALGMTALYITIAGLLEG